MGCSSLGLWPFLSAERRISLKLPRHAQGSDARPHRCLVNRQVLLFSLSSRCPYTHISLHRIFSEEETWTSIWLREYVWVETTTLFFQSKASPPLRLTQGTTGIEGNSKSVLTDYISLTVNFISIRKKIVGPFSLTKYVSTWTSRRFLSPWQNQLIMVMVFGGAEGQPLPLG